MSKLTSRYLFMMIDGVLLNIPSNTSPGYRLQQQLFYLLTCNRGSTILFYLSSMSNVMFFRVTLCLGSNGVKWPPK